MKRIPIVILVLTAVFILGSCSGQKEKPSSANKWEYNSSQKVNDQMDKSQANGKAAKADYIIKDNYFVGQLNDMTLNINNYTGKTVRYEGFIYIPEQKVDDMDFVVARKYYCCGTDSYIVGLGCVYEGTNPADNAWVEVTGIIEKRAGKDGDYPIIKVSNLVVMDTRGEEFVSQ
jgi:uncharacterized membrane protein YcgQ (UPF0703/DUF1980 family)